ncbi:MAG TPA: OsmC family protein [Myxococcota bacterium]|jgi:organic hydroperoxide reductase OsmC/OhrA|nr:OsmC family protein [Myxococcota bacterium]
MSEHRATTRWARGDRPFTYDAYSRTHRWSFGGGAELDGSAAPEYLGDAKLPNPEEALVMALSSCHMLSFLAIAARKRLTVESYEDAAVGHMEKNAEGRLAITRAELHPRVVFSGANQPTKQELAKLHEQAHHVCFIANSVRTEVTVVPVD